MSARLAAGAESWLRIDSLDLEGQGVGRTAEGKVVFVDGALAGETVRVRTTRRKPQWEQAELLEVRRESPLRVRPPCPHFGTCGGCKVQHLHTVGQVAVKQRALEDALWHVGKVRPERVLRPLTGPDTGYRHRARLTVRHVVRKGTVLVGFHERKSSYVADMTSCAVLPAHVSALLVPLRALIGAMAARDRLPQIEVAVGDRQVALVLRHLVPLVDEDRARLREFAARHGVTWWLQPQGPDSAEPMDPGAPPLAYSLPEFGLTMAFRPTDFTQVNHAINRALVQRAVRELDPQPDDRVADWFCGLGNFTLPIATRAGRVVGVEGSDALVVRAAANAAANGLQPRCEFHTANLFEMSAEGLARHGAFDRWLVDPPREGALALVQSLVERIAAQGPEAGPRRIVYVSCNPATLARDAGLLVHRGGYTCRAAGVINMFPHTAHVESLAVFDRLEAAPVSADPGAQPAAPG
ncbi:MAG: 23S rRNA (uracil(1939)-C(5))-methyltransferase RlmD [Ideonella sp.]|nr:23S rRNA (uracil(1939)-C(5))-methyltransferase RlmD [Ideonella sp.]